MAQSKLTPNSFNAKRPYTKADFDGSNAAPLLLLEKDKYPELDIRQKELAHKLIDAAEFELARYVKPPLVVFVGYSILTRMQQREGQNAIEYMRRLHQDGPEYELAPFASREGVDEACEKALFGLGTARQNDIARRVLAMASGEYKNLTIIGEYRKDDEPPMLQEVSELTGVDATPHFDQMGNFKILGFDRDSRKADAIGAIRIGMKRDIGTLDDETVVKNRTTAIIAPRRRTEFTQREALEIRDGFYNGVKPELIPAFLRVAQWLVDGSPGPGVVLARNETTYGFNAKTLEEIEARARYRY